MTPKPRALRVAALAVAAAAMLVAASLPQRTFAQATTAAEPSTSAPAAALKGSVLLAALRKGGYILYFRHASTDFGTNDEGMTSFEDCTKQRNLTDQGRAEARAIGSSIKGLDLPIGEVLASPFCRTMETARLAFGKATVENAVRGTRAVENEARYAGLRKLLSTPVSAGSDLVIVSHGNPFYAVAGPPHLAEGEAAVIEPLGDKGFRVVARVRKDEWGALRAS